MLAAYQAVSGISTVVVGQSERTQPGTTTPWIVTVLHEHFHQFQQTHRDYYSSVNILNLSRGDQSGMWTLHYPFAYDSLEVQEQFNRMTFALHDALKTRGLPSFQAKVSEFLKQRERFRFILLADDYKYFSLQIWQEGIARYTEYHIARRAGEQLAPSCTVSALPDFKPYASHAETLHAQSLSNLDSLDLGTLRRVTFYTIGAAEGLLLDEVNP